MPTVIAHPRDPATRLRVRRSLFGAWRLFANDREVAEDEHAEGYRVVLSDGSTSRVHLDSRRLDPYPVLVIDEEPFPLGRPLGVSGTVGALLPVAGVLFGFWGLVIGLIGVAATLRVARAVSAPPLRILSGLGFLIVAMAAGFIQAVGMVTSLPAGGASADAVAAFEAAAALPPLPGAVAGAAAATALTALPTISALPPTPAGTGPIAPLGVADVLRLRNLVLRGEFARADSAFAGLAEEARQDIRRETRWRVAYRMGFQATSDSLVRMLDRWVEASPGRPEPLAARAWSRYWLAYYWRGEGGGRMTGDQREHFNNALARGASDAAAAITIDARILPAYWMLQYAARVERDHEAGAEIMRLARTQSPTSYETFHHAILAVTPSWGGDLDQVAMLADLAAESSELNPQLEWFRGYAAWVRGDLRVESSGGEGVPHAREALRSGPDPVFLETLGHATWHAGETEEGLRWVDSSLVLEPTNTTALSTRRKILNRMGDIAGRDRAVSTLRRLRPLMAP
jgi:hypothetical protein